jgi:thiamine-phosphate pyrophosphorylase
MQGLYGIIDTSASPDRSHRSLTDALLAAGVSTLQLRMKDASEADVASAIDDVLPVIRKAGATLILNDHVELATRFVGVGAHIGQDDMDPLEARRLLGPDRPLGWSTHSVEDVLRAASLPVDYIGFGPVFSGEGKHRSDGDDRPPMEARGIDGLKAALEVATVPLVAIGGITVDNLADVVEAGAGCVAVISAVAAAPDPKTAARALQRAFDR